MKKWMSILLIGAITAGLAVAEETKVPWYKKLFGKSAEEQTQVVPPPPPPEMRGMQGELGGRQRPDPSPEQIKKMKAHRDELMKLGEAARNETDPVKKEAIVSDIRTKVTEMVDKMQAEQKKRLEKAEKELPKLRERLAEAEQNKAARIEEHVQKIISGEMPHGPDGKRPEQNGEGKQRKKLQPPPAAE